LKNQLRLLKSPTDDAWRLFQEKKS